ncbi:uncharacterized protein LOC134834761 [Culicoides brevitarsis]|uniref:uncharacterized protein LOC134834761 n=1 Tax=Culicoides brevitarsis TaxID=469753 RepID=UPI00307B35CC
MFEGLPKIKRCCGMDLKVICIVLGILELAFLAICASTEFTIYSRHRYESHFESKIWPMFLMIEMYVQYVIYAARAVLTSCLLYGLFTRNLKFLHAYVIVMIFVCIYYFLLSNVMLFTNFDVAIEYFITFFLDSITWLFVHSLHESWKKGDYEKANTATI